MATSGLSSRLSSTLSSGGSTSSSSSSTSSALARRRAERAEREKERERERQNFLQSRQERTTLSSRRQQENVPGDGLNTGTGYGDAQKSEGIYRAESENSEVRINIYK